MPAYYSTFIPGLGEPVKAALERTIQDARITVLLDGLVAYQSNATAEEIRNLPFVTNSFYILRSFDAQHSTSLSNMATSLLNDQTLSFILPLSHKRRKTFRIIAAEANQLVQIDSDLMSRLEKSIRQRTALEPDRARPDFEFWLSRRTEGHGFFAFRLSYHKAYDKSLEKGELRPELANVLCEVSEPLPGELFLDPFCGSGAIPIQRAKFFPKGLVIASDIDERKVAALKAKVKALGLTKRIVVRQGDALDLARYESGSIHKIVTDPPWGHFVQTSCPIGEFYERMLTEFARVLRAGGRVVIVTAETAALETGLNRTDSRLTLKQRFNILLSGKKASVYVLVNGGKES